MTLVFDATPLIYLAKVALLEDLRALEGPRLVTERVYEEAVVRGSEGGYPDARRIEQAIEQDVLECREAEDDALYGTLSSNPNLSDADVSVLVLADAVDGIAVMDEDHGRTVAAVEGIEVRGTVSIVLSLVRDGRLDADEAREVIDAMMDAGWYCSPALYHDIVERIENLE